MRLLGNLACFALPALAACLLLPVPSSQAPSASPKTGTNGYGVHDMAALKAMLDRRVGNGLLKDVNTEGLSQTERRFKLIDAAAQKITGLGNPGVFVFKGIYRKPITFGMSELNYNRLRLYLAVRSAESLNPIKGENEAVLAKRMNTFIAGAIGEAENRYGFKATREAKENVSQIVDTIICGKILRVQYGDKAGTMIQVSGQPDTLFGVKGYKQFFELAFHKYVDNPWGVCGDYSRGTQALSWKRGLTMEPTMPDPKHPLPRTLFSGAGIGFDRDLTPGRLTNHGWLDISWGFQTDKPKWAENDTYFIFRDPIQADWSISYDPNSSWAGSFSLEQSLHEVLSRLYVIDVNEPVLLSMFHATHVPHEAEDGGYYPFMAVPSLETYKNKDFTNLQPYFDFYSKLTNGPQK